MEQNDLKKRIMKRVYGIWFARRVAPAVFLYMPFLLIVALRETANEFFVARIVDNMINAVHGSGFSGLVNFTSSAATNIPVIPMMIILGSVGLFAYILWKLARDFRQTGLVKSY